MENDVRIIEALSHEQVVERAQAVVLELEYWQHILDDCATVNDALLEATDAVLDATSSTVMLTVTATPEQLVICGELMPQLRRALDAVRTIADAQRATVDLAAGRKQALEPVGTALRRAAGLEDHDSPDALQS
jgi:hypothetical protein